MYTNITERRGSLLYFVGMYIYIFIDAMDVLISVLEGEDVASFNALSLLLSSFGSFEICFSHFLIVEILYIYFVYCCVSTTTITKEIVTKQSKSVYSFYRCERGYIVVLYDFR